MRLLACHVHATSQLSGTIFARKADWAVIGLAIQHAHDGGVRHDPMMAHHACRRNMSGCKPAVPRALHLQHHGMEIGAAALLLDAQNHAAG